MAFLEFLKEIFSSPDTVFKKLLVPNYFSSQRAKTNTEEYARWLRKQYAYFGSMAYTRKYKGLSIPSSWIDGLRLIEVEIEKIKKQGTSHLFSAEDKKISVDLS